MNIPKYYATGRIIVFRKIDILRSVLQLINFVSEYLFPFRTNRSILFLFTHHLYQKSTNNFWRRLTYHEPSTIEFSQTLKDNV